MNFIILLIGLLALAIVITAVVVACFRKPIQGIFNRLIGEPLAGAWVQYLTFVLYVVGFSCAVNSYRIDNYVMQRNKDALLTPLNLQTAILEAYHTVESVLGGLAWTLTAFFIVALIAYIIVRAFELKQPQK